MRQSEQCQLVVIEWISQMNQVNLNSFLIHFRFRLNKFILMSFQEPTLRSEVRSSGKTLLLQMILLLKVTLLKTTPATTTARLIFLIKITFPLVRLFSRDATTFTVIVLLVLPLCQISVREILVMVLLLLLIMVPKIPLMWEMLWQTHSLWTMRGTKKASRSSEIRFIKIFLILDLMMQILRSQPLPR